MAEKKLDGARVRALDRMGEKEEGDNDTKETPVSRDPPSMASRIQASASGLLHSALSGSGANDLTATLVSALSSTGKVESSHASAPSTSRSFLSSSVRTSAPIGEGSADFSLGPFRSSFSPLSEIERNDGVTWEQFQHGSCNNLWLENHENLSDAKGKGKKRENIVPACSISPSTQNAPPSSASLANLHAAWDKSSTHGKFQHSTTYIPQSTDGADVISLLTSPSFQPTFTPPTTPFGDSPPEPFPFTPSDAPTPAPLTQLSLIPDLATVLASTSPEAVEAARSPSSMREYLCSIPGLAEWVELDELYQEDVWGYLRPFVHAAQEEMREQRAIGIGEREGPGPAVRRLGMILRQLMDGKGSRI